MFTIGWASYVLIMVETLAPRVRLMVISDVHGLAYGIVGRLTPLVAAGFVDLTGSEFASVCLLIAIAAISFSGLSQVPQTLKRTQARRAAA